MQVGIVRGRSNGRIEGSNNGDAKKGRLCDGDDRDSDGMYCRIGVDSQGKC